MHPLLEKRGYLALYLVAWLPIGVALAAALALSGAFDWIAAIAIGVPLALFEAFICLGAFYFCRAVPLRGTKPLAQLGSLVTSIVFSASLLVIAGRFWLYALQTLGFLAREATATHGYRRAARSCSPSADSSSPSRSQSTISWRPWKPRRRPSGAPSSSR